MSPIPRLRHYAVLGLLLLAALPVCAAPPPGTIEGSGNKFAWYFPAPHQMRMQALIEGAKTQPQPDGRVLITDAKLQSFSLEGAREMTVRAPQCWYARQANTGTLSSAGPLQASFADGEFTLEGEGFLLQQTNLSLTISNQVHSHIRGSLLGKALPPPATTNGPAVESPASMPADDLEVFSDQFSYATNTGIGIYRNHVRVAGTNLGLTSRLLEVVVPAAERRLESISAEGDVKVDSAGIQAAGDQAVYTVRTDEVRVSGQPTWRALEKEGSADELIIERTNGVLHANGNATLMAIATHLDAYGFLAPPGAAPARASNPAAPPVIQAVEIHSDNYLLRTNFACFTDHVRGAECVGDKIEGTITCGQLTLAGAGTNTSAIAERDVDMRQTDPVTGKKRRFTSGRAVYSGASGEMELTQTPKWEDGESHGTGDSMTVSTRPEGMLVKGNAFLSVPADELAHPPSLDTGAAPAPAPKRETPAKTFAQIYSESYLMAPSGGTFQGPVRLLHPDMAWKSGKLSVDLSKDKQSRRLLGENGVVFDVLDAHGATHHGTGEKADLISGAQIQPGWTNGLAAPYLSAGVTNEVLVLAGDPALLTDDTGNIRNKVIILDGITHHITAPGRYMMWGKGPPVSTNKFELIPRKSVK